MNKLNDPLNYTNREGHTICKDCLECITCGVCNCYKYDIAHLEHAIKNMTDRSKLYKVIKEEVKKRGHWKYKKRTKVKK